MTGTRENVIDRETHEMIVAGEIGEGREGKREERGISIGGHTTMDRPNYMIYTYDRMDGDRERYIDG